MSDMKMQTFDFPAARGDYGYGMRRVRIRIARSEIMDDLFAQ